MARDVAAGGLYEKESKNHLDYKGVWRDDFARRVKGVLYHTESTARYALNCRPRLVEKLQKNVILSEAKDLLSI